MRLGGILNGMGSKKLIVSLFAAVLLFAALANAAPAPTYADVEQAVVNYTSLQPRQQAVAAIVVKIHEGYHAQSHTPLDSLLIPFEVQIDSAPAFAFYTPVFPPGKNESYRNIDSKKPLNVYTGIVTVYVPLQVKENAAVGPVKISGTLSFQACDDKQCFQPTTIPFSIDTRIEAIGQPVTAQFPQLFKTIDPRWFSDTTASIAPPAPATEKLFGRFELKNNSYVLAFVAAFIAGIIFNAVPCVLPVLPLKAIGFYEVSQHNRAKCLAFGATFSAGLIASFGVLALVVVVYRKVGWGEIYSNPWLNLAIVVILLVMAIGTFGVFTVNLPVGIYNITPRHDTYLGNFLFGILTAILSTPCTFGLFVSLLVWAASQPAVIGATLVMTVGAGMAFPYFLLSAFPELARKFPRTGPWSDLVKQMMAFLLLGSAVFFARRFIVPFTGADTFWWILFAVAVVAGLYLVGRTIKLSPKFSPILIASILAIALIGGVFAAVWDIVQQPYTWTPYSPETLATIEKSHRVAVIDFTATWCSTCQYLEVHTLNGPTVVAAVKKLDVEMLKADLTSSSAPGWKLLNEKADFPAIPFTLVYGPGAAEPIKLNGIYSPEQLIGAIEKAGMKSVAIR